MRSKTAYYFILLLGLGLATGACEQESSRTVGLNTNMLSLKPSNNYNKRFANNSGDTVNLYLSLNEASTENISVSGSLGALGDIETIIAEKRLYALSCDTPYLRLHYRFNVAANPQDRRAYSDYLNLSISDSSGTSSNALSFLYQNDTVYLTTSAVVYYDTLNVIGQSFSEVYQPSAGLPDENLLFYYKNGTGIVGFSTRSGTVYELVN